MADDPGGVVIDDLFDLWGGCEEAGEVFFSGLLTHEYECFIGVG